jgi:hypothetical protein
MMYLEFLSGSWQYWTNLHVLPTVCLFCFSRFIFQVILSCTLCSFHIVTELPQPVATEQLPAINFFWPVNFSQIRVHRNVKNVLGVPPWKKGRETLWQRIICIWTAWTVRMTMSVLFTPWTNGSLPLRMHNVLVFVPFLWPLLLPVKAHVDCRLIVLFLFPTYTNLTSLPVVISSLPTCNISSHISLTLCNLPFIFLNT